MFSLGQLQLKSNLFLSPLAGYTNLPFRLVIREIGGVDLCTTDLVNARSLIEQNPKALKLIETNEQDSPLSVQLFGGVKEEMRDASIILQEHGVDSIGVNMGCPVPKVTKTGGGASMMNELPKTQELIRSMVDAVKVPITAKMRLGWDDKNLTAPELARALEDAGVTAIFVHGRTRAQGFDGVVNLEGIRKVVEAVRNIPVIGNGGVTTPEAAKHMIEQTGCHGVSAGRGAFYNPWIFLHTQQYLETGVLPPEPIFEERIRVLRRHYDLMVEVFGEIVDPSIFAKSHPGTPSALVRLSHLIMPLYASVHGQISKKFSPIIWNGANPSPMKGGSSTPLSITTNGRFLHAGRRRIPSQTEKGNFGSQRTRGSLVVSKPLSPFQGIFAISIPIPQVSVLRQIPDQLPQKQKVQPHPDVRIAQLRHQSLSRIRQQCVLVFRETSFSYLQPQAIHLLAVRKYHLHIHDIRISGGLQFLTNLHRTPTRLTNNLNFILFSKRESIDIQRLHRMIHRTLCMHGSILSGCSHINQWNML